jgi:hypothetical protein
MSLRSFFRLFLHVQMLPILESGEETLVGGQAVMEGVMMRAPHSYCVAVRKPTGEIVTEEMPVSRVSRISISTLNGQCCVAWAYSARRCRWA